MPEDAFQPDTELPKCGDVLHYSIIRDNWV